MLKIGKGLKKKKKSKKNKHKEDELFTEEELEQYRKEHAQKAAATAAAAAAEESGENSEAKAASEELEKFKLLTAGVDDILRKSQGDLDRIKKESFFQRKPTPSELKAQEEKEKEELKQTQGNWIDFEDKNKEKEVVEEEKEEESESEYEFDDKDDIFDTTYVDAIESGEVKLVYVPEDDEIIKPGEPDPFDTTSAEEILKKVEEEENKKKRQISLGLAVNVLTGRAERDKSILQETGAVDLLEQVVAEPTTKPKKRPRRIQEVTLIGSFDEGNAVGPLPPEVPKDNVGDTFKSLLDDDLNVECELPEGDVLISEVLVKNLVKTEVPELKTEPKDSNSDNLKDLVSEFDAINEIVDPEIKKVEEEEDEFDEFTALAASSLANQKLEEELQKFEDLEDDPFDTTTASIVLKEDTVDPFGQIDSAVPLPNTAELTSASQKWSAFDEQSQKEVDPFDTSFAERIQPGKCELKLLESEILSDIVEVAHKSDVHQEARILSRNNSDSDFNPREGEERRRGGGEEKRNKQSFLSKVSIQITDPSGFVETQRGSESESRDGDLVSLSFKHRDLLGGSTTDLTKLGDDPLPPEVESPTEDFSKYSDPFDTSIVDQVVVPGKAELKFIEKELLSDISRQEEEEEDVLSDADFDPRKEENLGQKVSFDIPSPITSDLLSAARSEGARPLTPYYADIKDTDSDTVEIEDPFDTSHVTSLPGKEELKIIEKELDSVQISQTVFEPIHKKLGLIEDIEIVSPGLKHSLSDQDFNPRAETEDTQIKPDPTSASRRYSDVTGILRNPPSTLQFQPAKPDLLVVEEELPVKALTPAIEEDISSYIDPFDTSIAENIVPGKAELKVLESELIPDTVSIEGGIKRSYTDPDFNPRDDNSDHRGPQTTDILGLQNSPQPTAEPLALDFENAADDIDPFDTSIAANLLPGKAEIRLLESELLGQ